MQKFILLACYFMKRDKIVDYILQICKNNHLTLDEIYEKIKENFKVWKTTVYRTVEFLVQQNKLRKIVNINKFTYYETIYKPHFHIIDEMSWNIIDIEEDDICINSKLLERFEKIYDIRIIGKLKND